MNKSFFTLIFSLVCQTLFATNGENAENPLPPIAVTEGCPSGLVANCVNAIMGLYCDKEIDLVIPGAYPLIHERSYISTGYDWKDSTEGFLAFFGFDQKKDNNQKLGLKFVSPEGAALFLSGANPKKRHDIYDLSIDASFLEKGMTNTSKGIMSGKTHPKNAKIQGKLENNACSVRLGNGEELHYRRDLSCVGSELLFEVQSIRKPSGNLLRYKYNFGLDLVSQVEMVSATENCSFAHYSLNHLSDDEFNRYLFLDLVACDGRRCRYQYLLINQEKKLHRKIYLEKVERPDGPNVHYEYQRLPGMNYAQLKTKRYPDGRYLGIQYLTKKEAGLLPNSSPVKSLTAPAKPNGEAVVTHRFTYFCEAAGSGRTEVIDALNAKTIYHYDTKRRLTLIEKPQHSKEWLYWSPQGDLQQKTLEGLDGPQVIQRYQYDERGNVLQKKTTANFSGGSPDNQENEILTYYYHPNRFNHKSAETKGKTTTHFHYLPEKDLLCAKYLTNPQGNIVRRWFYSYDAIGALSQEIEDDGVVLDEKNLNQVTERYIRRIKNRFEVAATGLPETIEELYLDENQQEKRLKLRKRFYSPYGKCIREETYDAEGAYAFCQQWQYDVKGNCIYEVDPLGNETRRTFDDNGNCLTEENPHEKVFYTYDLMNRLVGTKRQSPHGENIETAHAYDPMGNKTSDTDPYGNTTHYTYDSWGRITTIQHPDHTQTHKRYNSLDQEIATTDALGNTTYRTYNIRGQVTSIAHPDGTQEQNRYTIEGALKETITPTQLRICYTYDDYNRPLTEEHYSPQGELLAKTTHHYNILHLTHTIDPEGHTTRYEYDRAGRLILQERAGRTTRIHYDSLGRVDTETLAQNGLPVLITRYKRDALNRVIQETIETPEGEIQRQKYVVYDSKGRSILKADGPAETFTDYNLLDQPIQITDPLGNVTHISYERQAEHSAFITIKTVWDPSGKCHVTHYDPCQRPIRIETYNVTGECTSQEICTYDAKGRCIQSIHRKFSSEGEQDPLITRWTYDSQGRILTLTEAADTTNERITTYTYEEGYIKTLQKPDGIILQYSHDAWGNTTTVASSDQALHLQFTYDRLQRPLKAEDKIRNTASEKIYDPFGHVIEERLANGLRICTTYDAIDHLCALSLPDGRKAQFDFVGLNLKHVEFAQHHIYFNYDIQGNLLSQTFPFGDVIYQYDLKSQLIQKQDPFQQLEMTYDCLGNLLYMKSNNSSETLSTFYEYDSLNQLIKEQGPSTHTYTYDSLYNRTSHNAISYTLNSLNQIESAESEVYTWDPNGNPATLQTNETLTFHYDPLDRLTRIETPTKQIRYLYDGWNRRLEKIEADKIPKGYNLRSHNRYLYSGMTEFGATEWERLTQLKIFAKSNTADIGSTLFIELNDNLWIPLTNSHGDIVSLISPNGDRTLESYQFDAFGQHTVHGNRHSVQGQNPWRFQSKRHDFFTGWVHFGHRDYNPSLGRWMTTDPAGFTDSINLYQYLLNNPYRYTDPHGEFVMVIPLFTFCFGSSITAFALPSFLTLAQIATSAAVAYYISEVVDNLNEQRMLNEQTIAEQEEKKRKGKRKEGYDYDRPAPPYDNLPNDPGQCPADGFEWKGKGQPGSKQGGWHNPETNESWRADIDSKDHPPHWDYEAPDGQKGRKYEDNSFQWK